MQINATNLSTAQACTKLSVPEASCMLDEFSKPDNTEEIDTPKRPSDNLVVKKAIMDNIIVAKGTIHAVRGAVVDVVFAEGNLPPIYSALLVEWDRPSPLILEVHSHLDLNRLRAVSFQSTAGLARGVTVRTTGGLVKVPVGKACLDVCWMSSVTRKTMELPCPATHRVALSMRYRLC